MKRILSLFLIIVLGCFLLSGCKKAITVDELLSKGKYEKAYKKATGDRKEEVLKENLMAYLCKDLILEGDDNPSLKIKDCYYEAGDEQKQIVIVTSDESSQDKYWWITFDDEEGKYSTYGYETDLSKEDEESGEGEEAAMAILLNASRKRVKKIIEGPNELSTKASIRLTNLNKKGKLNDVILMEEAKRLYP